jgi:hypothetical protein
MYINYAKFIPYKFELQESKLQGWLTVTAMKIKLIFTNILGDLYPGSLEKTFKNISCTSIGRSTHLLPKTTHLSGKATFPPC